MKRVLIDLTLGLLFTAVGFVLLIAVPIYIGCSDCDAAGQAKLKAAKTKAVCNPNTDEDCPIEDIF